MAGFIGKFFLQFAEPLAFVGLVLFISLFLVRKKAKGALVLLIITLVFVSVLGNVYFATWFTRSMEWRHMPVDVTTTKADAIVLIAEGTYPAETPRLRVELGEEADRALFATVLYQRGAAPGILVVGDEADSESTRQLLIELGVPEQVIFLNQETETIYDLVASSATVLKSVNVESILLVSSALNMDRLRFAFEQSGLEVIPAPCDYRVTKASWLSLTQSDFKNILIRFMPDSKSFAQSANVLREYFTLAYYRMKLIL